MSSLEGQVAIVTGAAGGIGRGIVSVLAAAGARCLLLDRDPEVLGELVREVAAAGGDAAAAPCDLRDPVAIATWFQRFPNGERLDVLVNNAGLIDTANLTDASIEEWRAIFEVNVDAVMLMTQHAVRVMRKRQPDRSTGRRGTIVNLGAPVLEAVPANAAAYGTSKAALRYLTALAAREFAPELVATSLLYPGTVREGMWSRRPAELARRLDQDSEEVLSRWLAGLPAGRAQEPAEVGRLVAFLASAPGMTHNGHVVWGAPYSVAL